MENSKITAKQKIENLKVEIVTRENWQDWRRADENMRMDIVCSCVGHVYSEKTDIAGMLVHHVMHEFDCIERGDYMPDMTGEEIEKADFADLVYRHERLRNYVPDPNNPKAGKIAREKAQIRIELVYRFRMPKGYFK